MPRQRLTEQRIRPQVLLDHRGIGTEIEHAPDALHDEQQGPSIGKANVQHERGAGLQMGDADEAGLPFDLDAAPVV